MLCLQSILWCFSISSKAQIFNTIAGGSIGDRGASTSAYLYQLLGVALDAAGNLYLADQNNHRIRQVTQEGTISTVAGNGSAKHWQLEPLPILIYFDIAIALKNKHLALSTLPSLTKLKVR